MSELLLPEPDHKYPMMIVGRYKDTELGFVLTDMDIKNDECIQRCSIALRDNLLKEGK